MREQTIKGATIREKMLSQTAQNSSFFDIFATALQTLNYWDARPLGTGNWLYTTWQCIKKLETKSICKGDAITEKKHQDTAKHFNEIHMKVCYRVWLTSEAIWTFTHIPDPKTSTKWYLCTTSHILQGKWRFFTNSWKKV